ncbi:MAG: hypothetical protein AB7Q37_08630 [Pyrinomonadaceae bacterium]
MLTKIAAVLAFLTLVLVTGLTVDLSSNSTVSGMQDRGWKVFVKTSPCSERVDWVTVAKVNPTGRGGLGNWESADLIYTGTPMKCVRASDQNCTKAMADAEAAVVRASPRFSAYCCKEYTVWKQRQTAKWTIVVGKFGNPGLGWVFEDGPMCCEEAEEMTGLKGACSGGIGGGAAAGSWGPYQKGSVNEGDGRTLTFYRGTTPEQCQADCVNNPGCAGFTLIHAGAFSPNDPPMCYLIAEARKITPSSCCTTALKTKGGTGTTKTATDEIDLSGTWSTPYEIGNLRYTWFLKLSRDAKNTWSGTQTSVRQDGSIFGTPAPVTVEYLGNGKVRYTYLTQRVDGGIKADATFANGKLTIKFTSGDVAVYSKQQ